MSDAAVLQMFVLVLLVGLALAAKGGGGGDDWFAY